MSLLRKAWAWIYRSSQDSTKVSLTVKGFLTALVTSLTILAGLANIHIPGSETLTNAVDAIVAFIQLALLCVSSAVTAFGLLRKIWTTVSGDNAVVNEHAAFANPDNK